MAKCYLVAEVTITNPGPYVEYQQKVPAIVARYGGKYLTRAGTLHPLEGDLGIARMVIVEFESLDTARRFYESAEYAPLLKLRKETTQSHVALVEGLHGRVGHFGFRSQVQGRTGTIGNVGREAGWSGELG